ncbi:MAG: hypothetical protein LBE50_04220 [Gallionellaceae bacterium]|jgi:hypothetical protein|nr:hypothetical protein [Gallionellaceae bacterium]
MMTHAWRWLTPLLLAMFFSVPLAQAAEPTQQSGSVQIMEEFQKAQNDQDGANRALSDKDKHRIMFLLGIPLLLCILITAGLGIAMVVYGKQVFTAHMIFAGLSLTLVVAHVVAGMVWFYPF